MGRSHCLEGLPKRWYGVNGQPLWLLNLSGNAPVWPARLVEGSVGQASEPQGRGTAQVLQLNFWPSEADRWDTKWLQGLADPKPGNTGAKGDPNTINLGAGEPQKKVH